MPTLMARSKIKAEHVAELDAAIKAVFTALEKRQPAGVRYALCRLADGVTYVVMVSLDEGIENPILALAEYQKLQEGLKTWIAEPPISDQLTVIGSYRLF